MPEQTPAELAEQHWLNSRAEISGNRYQPKLVWTIRPMRTTELQKMIEADGFSPFRFIEVHQLDRWALKLEGAPKWAQWCYLCLVEVKARNIGEGFQSVV